MFLQPFHRLRIDLPQAKEMGPVALFLFQIGSGLSPVSLLPPGFQIVKAQARRIPAVIQEYLPPLGGLLADGNVNSIGLLFP